MVSCCKLGVKSFVLEVTSQSGKDFPVNLDQTNVIPCSDKKGPGPKAQLPPSEVQVVAERKQISVGSSLRARFQGPTQLSSLMDPGVQPFWPLGSSGHSNEDVQVPQLVTQADCHWY